PRLLPPHRLQLPHPGRVLQGRGAGRLQQAALLSRSILVGPKAAVGRVEEERHMANAKGTGLLMVWSEVPADKEADFNRWYNEEHLAERLAIPGFLAAARYEAVKSGPKHLACYELESAGVLESEAYRRVRSQPT